VAGSRHAFNPSLVPLPAAFVLGGIAVQKLSPEAAANHAYSIIVPRDRGEIANCQYNFIRGLGFADKTDGAALGIVTVDPFESCWLTI